MKNIELIKKIENQEYIDDIDLLLKSDEFDFSLIHYQILNGWYLTFLKKIFQPSILKMRTLKGLTVFETLIWRGLIPTLKSEYYACDSISDFSEYIFTDEYKEYIHKKVIKEVEVAINRGYIFTYPQLITAYCEDGYPLIVLQIKKGWKTENKSLLKNWGWGGESIAHIQAKCGDWVTDDPEILKVRNMENETVAHYLAKFNDNWIVNDMDILLLENRNKKKVIDIILEKGGDRIKKLSNEVKENIIL